ncbi:MAG: DUF350 domain-containing protein [Candidatus Bipolaricaulia bacterium]
MIDFDFVAEVQNLAFLAIAFVYMWIAKKIFDFRSRARFNADHAIEEESNLAVGLRRGALYLAIPLGMFGAISGPSAGFAQDVQDFSVDGAVLTVFLLIATWINDKIIVTGIDNTEAIREGNTAVGLVEAGALIATGFIAQGSFSGEGGGVLNAFVFFLLGQIALVVLVLLYEWLTPFRAIEEIRNGNHAAGLMVGGMMVALGIILSFSIAGDFTSWQADLATFGYSALKGIVVLLVAQWFIDLIFLPHTDLQTEIERDRNAAAIAVTVGLQIALALLIAGAIV